jgi:putative ABC transport system permease protein
VRDVPGTHRVEPFLGDVASFEGSNIPIVCILGWLPQGAMMTESLQLIAGRAMQSSDKNATLLGSGLAESLGKKVGDKLEMVGVDFDVIGIFAGANMTDSNSAIVSLRDLQHHLGVPGRVTFFLVQVEPGRNEKFVKEVCDSIDALEDAEGRSLNLQARPTMEHARSHIEMKVVRGMAWSTSFIAMLIGIIGVLNTMMISVSERTSEIGTLRAVGWKKRRIVRMILGESLVLYCLGAPLGILISMVLTGILSRLEATTTFIPAVTGLPIIAHACLLAFVATLLGSLYPAVRASRLLPTEALHHE